MKKVNFGALALVVGLGAAFATDSATSKTFDTLYGQRSDGSWIEVTPQTEAEYHCVSSSQVCKATFPQDPNEDQSGRVISQNNGTYMLK